MKNKCDRAAPDANATFVELKWEGPFSFSKEGLGPSITDRMGPNESDIDRISKVGGIYTIIGDHPFYGSRTLLYIGSTDQFYRRLDEHTDWILEEWRVEVYLAPMGESKVFIEDCEKLLIYAHSPPYNSKNIEDCQLTNEPLRVWNTGRYRNLYPEISSSHPLYNRGKIGPKAK